MVFLERFQKWRKSKQELFQRIEKLELDNANLRSKNHQLQHAKELAERQADERRREKEALRARLAEQKKHNDSVVLVSEQLKAKVTELRAENDLLLQKKSQVPENL